MLTLWAGPQSRQRVYASDQAVLVAVPAGDFTMGSRADEPPVNTPLQYVGIFPDEFPQHKVTLDGFWIYKYAVTIAQYRRFCTETHRAMPPLPEWAKNDVPMVNVTWQDANDYAHWAGGMLPTEAQYEKAARGTDVRTFPWGSSDDTSFGGVDEHCITAGNGRSLGAQPVGSAPAGASPYGALDMTGNVWEWCGDWYRADYYQNAPAVNPTGPAAGSDRVIRGGSWFTTQAEDFRCAARGHIAPEQHNYFTGFRCVVLNP